MILEKFIPDHRPILLFQKKVDYGLITFRFFNSWLLMDDFRELEVKTWTQDGIFDSNGMVAFKKEAMKFEEGH